jgi:hypothetical protein
MPVLGASLPTDNRQDNYGNQTCQAQVGKYVANAAVQCCGATGRHSGQHDTAVICEEVLAAQYASFVVGYQCPAVGGPYQREAVLYGTGY